MLSTPVTLHVVAGRDTQRVTLLENKWNLVPTVPTPSVEACVQLVPSFLTFQGEATVIRCYCQSR